MLGHLSLRLPLSFSLLVSLPAMLPCPPRPLPAAPSCPVSPRWDMLLRGRMGSWDLGGLEQS